MLLFRKIDRGIQVTLVVLMVLSLPVLLLFGFMAGLFLLGFLQLLSASLNTGCFLSNGFAPQICRYWKFTGLVFALLFICVPLGEWFDPDDVQVIAVAAVMASVPLALYYISIYTKLIGQLALRNELEGLIKSKHG